MADRRESERRSEMEQIQTGKKVAFQGQESPLLTPTAKKSDPERSQFVQSSRRHRTDLKDTRIVESRAFSHNSMFRRPRALHYECLDDDSTISPSTTHSRSSFSSRRSSSTENDAEERSTDNISKVRTRLDLFVDLIWVGIIAVCFHTIASLSMRAKSLGAMSIAV